MGKIGDLVTFVRDSCRFNYIAYLLGLWKFFLFAIFIFVAATAWTTGYALINPEYCNSSYEYVSNTVGHATGDPTTDFWKIFPNNIRVSVLTIILGAVSGGLFAGWALVLNGYVFGAVLAKSLTILGVKDTLVMFLLLVGPHGVIELPTFFLEASIGMRIGYQMFMSVLYDFKNRKNGLRSDFSLTRALVQATCIFVSVILPLVILAAIIESWVTGHI